MRYIQLLRSRAPLLFWLGQLTSAIGDRLYAMTVMWMVMESTGSPALMATVSLVETVTYLLAAAFGGVLADRWNRAQLLIGADLGRAVVVFGLVSLHVTGLARTWHFLAAAACLAVLEAFFGPTLKSVVPNLVAEEQIQAMVGLMDTTGRLARIAGPGLAGLLLTLVPRVHLITFNAVSFLVSALTLALIARPLLGGGTPGVRRSFAANWKGGLATVARDRNIVVAFFVRGLGNVAWAAFTIGVPLLVQVRFASGMGLYGLILGAYGAGNLAGNLVAGNLSLRSRFLQVTCLSWGAIGLGFIGLGLAPLPMWAMAAAAWMGFFAPPANVTQDAYLLQTVPRQDLAKVFSLQQLAVTGGGALGMLGVGAALEQVAPGAAIAGAGGWILVTALAGLLRTSPLQKRAHLPQV